MLSALTLDDATGVAVPLISDPKRQVMTARGFYGVAAPRDSKRPRPQAHGAINDSRWEDGKLMVVEGEIGSNVSVADAYTEFRAILAPMIQTWDSAPALMKWSEPSGLSLQRLVKLDGEVDPPLEEAAAILRYQAQFFAEDPRAYAQTLTTATGLTLSTASGGATMPATMPVTFAISGGGTVSFTNAGNRGTPPVWRIYGYAVNPQIVFVGDTSARRIVLSGTVPVGNFLELDAYNRTLRINGVTNAANMYDASRSTWWDLPAGVSNFQVVADDFDGVARLDCLARSAYA